MITGDRPMTCIIPLLIILASIAIEKHNFGARKSSGLSWIMRAKRGEKLFGIGVFVFVIFMIQGFRRSFLGFWLIWLFLFSFFFLRDALLSEQE
jgi:hypothetical protein